MTVFHVIDFSSDNLGYFLDLPYNWFQYGISENFQRYFEKFIPFCKPFFWRKKTLCCWNNQHSVIMHFSRYHYMHWDLIEYLLNLKINSVILLFITNLHCSFIVWTNICINKNKVTMKSIQEDEASSLNKFLSIVYKTWVNKLNRNW